MSKTQGENTLESMSQADWYNQWTLNQFKNYLHGRILEIGCGIGNFSDTLTNYGSVTSIDINRDYINQTNRLLNGKGQAGFGNIEEGRYFFNTQQFDTIVCLNVLEHVNNDNQALINIYKLLKKDGILILLVPVHQFLFGEIDKSINHFRRYDKAGLINTLKSLKLKILSARRLNLLGALGWFFAGKILKEKMVKQENIKIFNLFAPLTLPIERLIEPPIGTSVLIIAKKV